MEIKYEKRDLFTVSSEYYLAHCVSSDFALGAGIAKKFNHYFGLRDKLIARYPLKDGEASRPDMVGAAVLCDHVFNLITKDRYWEKPTYNTLLFAIGHMRQMCLIRQIKKLAMPKIGCGLDRLDWSIVSKMIEYLFRNDDIEILICEL